MKKEAYVALPISGTNLIETKKRAEEAKAYLIDLGFDVKTPFDLVPDRISDKIYLLEQKLQEVNSVKVSKEIQKQVNVLWAKALGKCLEYLVTCDLVYMLNGWPQSKGASVEGFTADLYNIPTYFESNKTELTIKDILTSKELGRVAS